MQNKKSITLTVSVSQSLLEKIGQSLKKIVAKGYFVFLLSFQVSRFEDYDLGFIFNVKKHSNYFK